MASLRGQNRSVPLCLPLDVDDVVWVPESVLSHRFNLVRTSIWIEQEVYDEEGKQVVATIMHKKQVKDTEVTWKLPAGKFRVFGDPVHSPSVPIPESQRSTVHMSLAARVKVESSDKDTILLSESSDDEVIPRSKPQYSFLSPITETVLEVPETGSQSLSSMPSLNSRPPLPPKTQSTNVLDCLRQLQSRPRAKSDLKFLNLDTLRCERVKYLPPEFNGDVLFEFPPVSNSSSPSIARQMEGMDKRYDGHAWTKTYTTNIVNDFGLTFRSSNCIGHLQCVNETCPRLRRTGSPNETDWEGISLHVFAVGENPPSNSTLVCRICKSPPSCLDSCPCRMYYVVNKSSLNRACIHVGTHQHPIAKGICRESVERVTKIVGNEVNKTPTAKNSAIALAASKEFLSSEIFALDREDTPEPLRGDSLVKVMERFRILSSPNIRNAIATFRPTAAGGPLDNIIKLKMKSPYAYIQDSVFPGQGKDKVYLFKMSEEGPGSGVALVKRMQPGEDLQNSWIMFDHVKRVKGWTTMACHVYDPEYCRVMSIAVCDMQSEDVEAQKLMWMSLNKVMAQHGTPKPNFKGFMADSAQANWNAVRIIYGSGDPTVKMVDRERSCLLHWVTSLNRHTTKLIRPEFREQHIRLCKQYKDAKTTEEAEELYLGIKGWWLSSRAASEEAVRELNDWLGFWHFRYRQWGGFMDMVQP